MLEIKDQFHPVITPDGNNGSLRIRQDAKLYVGKFNANGTTVFNTEPTRQYWIQIAHGDVEINGEQANAGDGFAISDETMIQVKSTTPSEILLFDMAV